MKTGLIRENFLFYGSYYEAISESGLPDDEQGLIYKAIIDYAIAKKEPKYLTSAGKMCFKLIKPTIDSALKRYDASVQNGRAGGRPRNQTQEKPSNNPSNNPDKTQQEPNINLEETQEKPRQNLIKEKEKEKEKYINIKREKYKEFIDFLSLNFPKISINEFKTEIDEFDFDKLKQAIQESSFLQSSTLSFIFENYEKVINGNYKDFNKSREQSKEFGQRKYTSEEMNDLFDDLEDLEI